jgi:hypothetical protein
MNRKQYKALYESLELTDTQKGILMAAMEDLMRTNARKVVSLGDFYDGKVEGLNTAYRFIAGTMEDHDEFEK